MMTTTIFLLLLFFVGPLATTTDCHPVSVRGGIAADTCSAADPNSCEQQPDGPPEHHHHHHFDRHHHHGDDDHHHHHHESSWIIEGFSLIEDGRPAMVPFDMGLVSCRVNNNNNDDDDDNDDDNDAGVLSCKYSGANEVNFNLVPLTPLTSTTDINDGDDDDSIIMAAAAAGSGDGVVIDGRPSSRRDWRVQIVSETKLIGDPDELLMEGSVRRLFLYDNSEITTTVQLVATTTTGEDGFYQNGFLPREWMMIGTPVVRVSKQTVGGMSSKQTTTSITLMPASTRRGSQWTSPDMEGFWEMNLLDRDHDHGAAGAAGAGGRGGGDRSKMMMISLKVNMLSDRHYACQLNGANIHSFRFTQLPTNKDDETKNDDDGDAVDIGLISSTTLSSLDQKEEMDLIRQLGSTTHIRYDPVGPHLVFVSHDKAEISFARNPHVVLHDPFHSTDSTFWQAMPETLLLQNSSSSSALALTMMTIPESLVVELVLSDFSLLLDIIIDGRRLLRFTELSTLGKPLTLVSSLVEPDDAADDIAVTISSLRAFLEQVETVETYDNERFLSIVGLSGSMSFHRVPGPTPGLWVLDTRYSKSGGSLEALTRRATLRVTNEGQVLRGSINVSDGVIRFRMDNTPVLAGRGSWSIEEVAVRPSTTPEAIIIEQFMQAAGPLEMSGVRGESLEALVISNGSSNQRLVFLHPSDLSSVLVGSWMMISHSSMPAETLARVGPVELVLQNSGVGHLKGRVMVGGESYPVTMDEMLAKNSIMSDQAQQQPDDGIPSTASDAAVITWNIHISGTPHIHHHHHHHSTSNAPTPVGHDIVMKDLSRAVDVRVMDGELVIRSSDGATVQLKRVVPRRIRHKMAGEWQLLFAAISEDLLTEEEVDGVMTIEDEDEEDNVPPIHLVISAMNDDGSSSSNSSDSLFNVDVINHRSKEVLSKTIMTLTPDSEVTFSNTTTTTMTTTTDSTDTAGSNAVMTGLLRQFLVHEGSRMMEVSHQKMLIADSESMVALARVRKFHHHHHNHHHHHHPSPAAAAVVEASPVVKAADVVVESVTTAGKKDVMTLVRRRLQAAQALERVAGRQHQQHQQPQQPSSSSSSQEEQQVVAGQAAAGADGWPLGTRGDKQQQHRDEVEEGHHHNVVPRSSSAREKLVVDGRGGGRGRGDYDDDESLVAQHEKKHHRHQEGEGGNKKNNNNQVHQQARRQTRETHRNDDDAAEGQNIVGGEIF